MIITREIINKNIKFHDIKIHGSIHNFSYNYSFLSNCIDLYKIFLLDNGVKSQDTVAIVELISVWQIAALFACFELGVKVAIYDFVNNKLSKLNLNYDSKTKALLPINYILISPEKAEDIKLKYCFRFVDKILVRNFENNDVLTSNKNDLILATKDCIITKSTTSGTTAAPKLVEHTHEFLHSLTLRNASQFYGVYATFYNLNHGSSVFCYFVPAIASKNVTDIYNFKLKETQEQFDLNLMQNICKINHIMLPYPQLISKWLNEIKNNNLDCFKQTNIHTLSYIQEEWVNEYYKTGVIGDIISNFGSNETAGPIFLNKASDENFSETSYSLIDDYFKVEILNKTTNATLPIYNKSVRMNDYFEVESGKYIHKGRSDWIRINDFQVREFVYKDIVDHVLNGELFYDQIKSQIYLSVWESFIEDIDEKVLKISGQLKKYSDDRHYISKYDYLNRSNFISGIKIDKEMIREYFRNPDGDYQTLD